MTYSVLNIIGLTLGLASVIVIGTWVHHEYSYDEHFNDHERIYRIGVNFYNVGAMSVAPFGLVDQLKEYPAVETTAWLQAMGRSTKVEAQSQEFMLPGVFAVSDGFFDVEADLGSLLVGG